MKKIIIVAAIAFFSIDSFSQNVTDLLLKARAQMSEGEIEAALSGLESVIPAIHDYRLYLEHADACSLKGDYSGAISDLNEANNLSSGSGEYGLAKIYALRGDVSTSLYHLESNINSTWKKSEKEIMLDPAFGAVENKPEWKSFWRKDRYTEVERKISEIEFYTSLGKTDDARQIVDELKSAYPGNDAVAYAGALYFNSAGKPAEAVKLISPLLDADKNNEKYLRLLAAAQEALSNPAGASVTYTKMLDSGMADAGLLLKRAAAYRKTGENDKALNDVEKFLSLYPSDKDALSLAGKTQVAAGDNLRAIELFSKNLSLHPNDAQCYIDRANSYFMSRTWDKAIADYSMSLDLKPDNPEVWLNKGVSLLNSENKQEACHDFRKALSMGNKKASEYISRNCIK